MNAKYPCGQCGKKCGRDSIHCALCMAWTHRCVQFTTVSKEVRLKMKVTFFSACVPMSSAKLRDWSSVKSFMCPNCVLYDGDTGYDVEGALRR